MERINEIISYWFGDFKPGESFSEERMSFWFEKNEENDGYIKEHFQNDIIQAKEGKLKDWESTPEGYLVCILLLDQFTRNVYRNTPEAYAYDSQALRLCLRGLERGIDQQLPLTWRVFFYLPMEHSEDVQIQQKCVNYFTLLAKQANDEDIDFIDKALDYAIRHSEIVERFGRFPNRNAILGRESTKDETDFLNEFGMGI